MAKLGIGELLIILAIVLLIVGPKALPKLGESMGKTIGKFKKGLNEDDEKTVEEEIVSAEKKDGE